MRHGRRPSGPMAEQGERASLERQECAALVSVADVARTAFDDLKAGWQEMIPGYGHEFGPGEVDQGLCTSRRFRRFER